MNRAILHCDLNNFYASVECMKNPEYKNRPLAVTGNPKKRTGIILAKNTLAKSFGVKTGDVIWKNDIGSMQNMLLAGDYLFLISNRNILYAVDKEDGNIMWSLDMRDFIASEDEIDGEVYASQPIMINGNILLAFSNGKMFKINASKGKVIAKSDLEIDISNGVIIAKEKVIAVSDEADVIVFE